MLMVREALIKKVHIADELGHAGCLFFVLTRSSAVELEKVFRELGLDPTPDRIAGIMRLGDLDGNGELEWTEFLHIMKKQVQGTTEFIFELFDQDKYDSGRIACNATCWESFIIFGLWTGVERLTSTR